MDRKYWKNLLPTLEDVWLPYLKHQDKLNGCQAINEGEPHFYLMVQDPYLRDDEQLTLCCMKDRVVVQHRCNDKKFGFYETYDMTHENALAYLEQLPKPFYAFTDDSKLDTLRQSLINKEED